MASRVHKPGIKVGQLAAGAVIAAVFLGGILLVARESPDAAGTRALEAAEARAINTLNGQLANATLEDGTQLRMGPGSQLKLAKGFGKQMRVSALVGTAQFTIPEAEKPLELRLGDAKVIGNGATVDVRADSGTAPIVRVREGQVTVRLGEGERTLGPGEAVLIQGTVSDANPEAVTEAVAWTDGRFVMTNRPLTYVLSEWRRWYGTELGIGDAAILEKHVTMDAPLESAKDALPALEKGGGLRYSWVDKDIMLWNATARR